MEDPVVLYKDGTSRRIPAIDAPGWEAAGWRRDPIIAQVKEVELPASAKSQTAKKDPPPTQENLKETLEKLKTDNPSSTK
jgi:hypothetical protein